LPPPAQALAKAADRRQSSPRMALFSEGASNVVTLRTSTTEAMQSAAESAGDPFKVPEGLCPKCLASRGDRQACGQCGLDFARTVDGAFDPPDWLAQAWRGLLDDWSNEGLHASMRLQASQRDGLAELGRLYRLRLAWFPDDPWAETGREEILRLATAGVSLRQPAEGSPAAPRAKTVLTILLLLALAAAAVVLLQLLLQSSAR
jgi:ribosomal protein S27AE